MHNNKNANNELTIDFINKFNLDCLSFGELEESKGLGAQKNAYPKYIVNGSEVPPFFQLVWFYLESGGVPNYNEFIKEEKQRMNIRIPLILENPLVKKCYDKLVAIDEKFGSDEYRESLGSKFKKYIYQPIVRYPDEDDENDKKKNKNPKSKHPYIKIKIDVDYNDNDIKTIVLQSVLNNEACGSNENRRIRTRINDIKTIDDFAKHVSYRSTIRPIIKPFKMWFMASNSKYGISLKMIKVEVEPSQKTESILKNYLSNIDTFIDSDDEKEIKKEIKKDTKKENEPSDENKNKIIKKLETVKDSDDDSDNSDDNSDEEIKPVKKKEVVESESDSDEEIKPAVKKAAKSAAKKK